MLRTGGGKKPRRDCAVVPLREDRSRPLFLLAGVGGIVDFDQGGAFFGVGTIEFDRLGPRAQGDYQRRIRVGIV